MNLFSLSFLRFTKQMFFSNLLLKLCLPVRMKQIPQKHTFPKNHNSMDCTSGSCLIKIQLKRNISQNDVSSLRKLKFSILIIDFYLENSLGPLKTETTIADNKN